MPNPARALNHPSRSLRRRRGSRRPATVLLPLLLGLLLPGVDAIAARAASPLLESVKQNPPWRRASAGSSAASTARASPPPPPGRGRHRPAARPLAHGRRSAHHLRDRPALPGRPLNPSPLLPVVWDDLPLRCRDGVTLATRRWRPEGPGSWPVLLMRQPYGRAIASTPTYAHPSWYAAHGFQVVVVDVRGRGDSEGHFAGFAQEVADGADAVRWCRRLDHADGRVGGYGFSYQGLTQLLSDSPDAEGLLDALAPAHCGLDERLHWASEGGAHWWALGLAWALQLAAQGCRRRGDADGWSRIRRSLESGAFLQEGEELLERLDPGGMGLAWLRRDPATAAGWTVHEPPPELLRRPLLLIGGWHDPHLRGVLDLWHRARRAGGSPWLRIGAWSHLHWRGGIDALQLAFFQRFLAPRPIEAGPPPPPLLLERLGGGAWIAADPEVAHGGSWALASGGLAAIRSDEGRLLPKPSAGASGGSVTLVHDPGGRCRAAAATSASTPAPPTAATSTSGRMWPASPAIPWTNPSSSSGSPCWSWRWPPTNPTTTSAPPSRWWRRRGERCGSGAPGCSAATTGPRARRGPDASASSRCCCRCSRGSACASPWRRRPGPRSE